MPLSDQTDTILLDREPTVKVLASGLHLLSFQGMTPFQNELVVVTGEANLVKVSLDGTVSPWVNVARYGIPTGIVGTKAAIAVALSGQESGHFLIEVTPQGEVTVLADLSALAGEFGAPFAITAYEGYYPYYLVAISTDVIGSAGLIAQVKPSGKTTIFATLANTAFGIGIGEDYVIATQDQGSIVKIHSLQQPQAIANLEAAQLGRPLDLTRLGEDWLTVTTTGWLVALQPDGSLSKVINLAEQGYGLPTTLTTFGNQLIVATQAGNLLQVTR